MSTGVSWLNFMMDGNRLVNPQPVTSMTSDAMDDADEKELTTMESIEYKEDITIPSQGTEEVQLSAKEGQNLRWKLDLVVLSLITVAYLVAYMDRNNIGYARLMGLQQDLVISNDEFYDAIMVFYAGYLAAVFPANFALQKLGPRIQFGGCVVLFGMLSCCFAAARTYGSVVVLRLFLGMAEACLQSVGLYLVALYGRDHLTKRVGILYSASTVAGAFSGFIAYGVQKDLVNDSRPTWQWLFIIEGSLGLLVGLLMVALLPGFPRKLRKSYLFTNRQLVSLRALDKELDGDHKVFDRRQALQCLRDKRVYFIALLSVCNIVLIASVGAFLPTIILELGFSDTRSQLMAAVPYCIAFATMLIVGYLSDWLKVKAYLIIACLAIASTGFIVLMSTYGKISGMAGTCLVVMGVYPAAVLQLTWVQITFCGKTKRALAYGIALFSGQGASLAAAYFYTDPPRFVKGYAICLGFVVVGILATSATAWTMHRDNRARDAELAAYAARGAEHPGKYKSMDEMCDMHVLFRYPV